MHKDTERKPAKVVGRRGLLKAVAAAVAALAAAVTLAPAAAALEPAVVLEPTVSKNYAGPRYVVRAVSFKAVDESGWDGSWYAPVSDEPYWVFSSVGASGTATTRHSREFSDVDSGETRSFSSTESVIWSGGATGAGLGFSIQVWEADGPDWLDADEMQENVKVAQDAFKAVGPISLALGAPAWVVGATGAMLEAADYLLGALQDDLLGTRTFAYSSSYLSSRLPAVGNSFTDVRRFSGAETGDGAVYDLTLRVSRVA